MEKVKIFDTPYPPCYRILTEIAEGSTIHTVILKTFSGNPSLTTKASFSLCVECSIRPKQNI
jgi:hypothetical protein